MFDKSIFIAIVYFIGALAIDYNISPPFEARLLYRLYYVPDFNSVQVQEIVRVDVFYESLCPDCIREYPNFPPLVEILGTSVDLRTYPFGNGKMHKENGTIVVKCQHGEAECYGNKLHACAIDILNSTRSWVYYNACLMSRKSDDKAADKCGKARKIDSEPIKDCANSPKGQELLIHYGNLSLPHHYPGVPYVLINGNPKPEDEPLFNAVCRAFKIAPPDVCKYFL